MLSNPPTRPAPRPDPLLMLAGQGSPKNCSHRGPIAASDHAFYCFQRRWARTAERWLDWAYLSTPQRVKQTPSSRPYPIDACITAEIRLQETGPDCYGGNPQPRSLASLFFLAQRGFVPPGFLTEVAIYQPMCPRF